MEIIEKLIDMSWNHFCHMNLTTRECVIYGKSDYK